MSSPLRIGIVGLQFGHLHVRSLLQEPGFRIVALADSHGDSPTARLARSLAPGARFFERGEELLEQTELDAICLSTSPVRRTSLLLDAVGRGLPVFVEKPWAVDSKAARELTEEVRRRKGRVMVGFSFRFHPALVRLRELLNGDLGHAWMLNAEYAFEWPIRAEHWMWSASGGAGFFNENSCHLFDAVCHLLGRPVSVAATTGNPRGAPGPEIAAITLGYESGAIAALTVGAVAAQPFEDFPRIDLVTANGQARLRGRHHIWESLQWALRGGSSVASFSAPPERLGTTRYTHAWRHFEEMVRARKPFASTPEEGERAVHLATAVFEAAQSQTTVHLESP